MSRVKLIHHVNVQISDRQRTREWYEKVLDAEFLDRGRQKPGRSLCVESVRESALVHEEVPVSTGARSHYHPPEAKKRRRRSALDLREGMTYRVRPP